MFLSYSILVPIPCYSFHNVYPALLFHRAFQRWQKMKLTALISQTYRTFSFHFFLLLFYVQPLDIEQRTLCLQIKHSIAESHAQSQKQNKTKISQKYKAKLSVTKFQQSRLHQVQTWCPQSKSEEKIQELCNIEDKNQKGLK